METENQTKTIKFNDNFKYKLTQNAKGIWKFAEITVSSNLMDEEIGALAAIRYKHEKKQWSEVGGLIFDKEEGMPAIEKVESSADL